jgi:transposase InsO family protein
MNEYPDFNEACNNIENFIEEVYNKKRIHSSIGYKTPEGVSKLPWL